MTTRIEPSSYVVPDSLGGPGDMSSTSAVRYGIVTTSGVDRISFTFYAPASTARAQTFILYGTDDPRAKDDKEKIIRAGFDTVTYTPVAKWQAITLPAASVHFEDQTGFSITLPATDLALGTAEGLCIVNLVRLPAFLEWRLVASGTASTGSDDLSIWKSGN